MGELRYRHGISVEADGAWLLLAELNHRVGNELAAALAALRMVQRRFGKAAESTGFLDQAILRLENFGQVHHLLDRNRPRGTLNQRLEALCQATQLSKAASRGIHVVLSADDVAVDDEIAWTVCVVASELLTNVFKHAFDDEGDGLIVVDLREERGAVFLSVADNGTGTTWPRSSACSPASPGAGWGIITELTERLGGAVTRQTRSTGTTVTVRVPTGQIMQ